jgi:hypothetical protein
MEGISVASLGAAMALAFFSRPVPLLSQGAVERVPNGMGREMAVHFEGNVSARELTYLAASSPEYVPHLSSQNPN